MAHVGSTRESLGYGARIAGPRRTRATPPPLPATQAVAPTPVSASDAAALVAPEPAVLTRELPPLDFDEPTARYPTVSPTDAAKLVERSHADLAPVAGQIERNVASEPRARSAKWFAVGLVLGVLVITLARGDATPGVRAARLWGATALRSLKKTTTNVPVDVAPGATNVDPPPCSLTDEDCAILMAPFVQAEATAMTSQIEIPLVDVSSLPKWKPPVVYVAPPAKALDIAAPVAQPDVPAAAGAPPPVDEGKPKIPQRAPGPFDAPGPIDTIDPAVASAPATP